MMHARWLGAVLVIGAASVWGQIAAGRLAERMRLLVSLETALDIVETEVSCGQLPVASVFARAAAVVGGRVGNSLGAAANASEDTVASWLKLLRQLTLTSEDLAVIEMLCTYLGGVDRREQVRHIRACRDRLRTQISQARELRRRYEPLYRYLGPLAGLGAVVLLI